MANEEHLALLRQGADIWNRWRQENLMIELDLSKADLSKADLSRANLNCANLSKANLNGAYLSKANLINANLNGAKLSGVDLYNAYLSHATFINATFSSANLREANLSHANLSHADLNCADLSCANFYNANLSHANLSYAYLHRTNLSHANLRSANFRSANLSRANLSSSDLRDTHLMLVQALATNFTSATLTGACLQDWHINRKTKLDDMKCDYVYRTAMANDRRPSSGNFAPGEFTLLFKKALDTVDLIFADGIDWKTFFQSFQELRSQYADNISIQAIEKKSGDAFVIRLEVPSEADKAAIYSQAKELYERDRQIREAQYRERLNAKDNQIEIYKQQSASMEEIAKLLATRPIKFEEPKVTLQPTQIKILQAIQDGKEDSDSVAIAVNLSTDTVEYYLTEMNRDGYVRYFPSLGEAGGCNLTSKGRVALNDPDLLLSQRRESSVSINQTFKNDLRGSNIINFSNQVRDSASQNASQFSQVIGQNADELIRLIATLRETAQTFPAEQREEALGHLDDLQEDLSKPERQEPSRIKRRLKALVAIVLTLGTMAAGTVDFANNLTDLSEKLGVPIELSQSQTSQQLPSADGR